MSSDLPPSRGYTIVSRPWQGARKVSMAFARWFEVTARTYPARVTVAVFLILITIITSLLSLPIATLKPGSAHFIDALFTAVSAVCVTGLTTVSTATYWSGFGELIIMLGIFIGGLGVMILASLLAFAVSRHLGLTQRLLVRDASGDSGMSNTGTIVMGVFLTSVTVETVLFVALFVRLLAQGTALGDAAWDALFMSISSFNNAGFVNLPGDAEALVGDWGVLLPVIVGAFIGALGFPVLSDLRHNRFHVSKWSLHTKLTTTTFLALVLISIIFTGSLEWRNPDSFGALPVNERILNTLLAGVNPRSLGVSPIPVENMRPATLFIMSISMFIGGGSASTAGGIKVTTFALLLLAVVAEARGSQDVETFRRRVSVGTLRLAVSVLMISATLVGVATFMLLLLTDFSLDQVLFESISAFGTVGLSTGITSELPASAQILLAGLMLAGRLGPMTLATALALREQPRLIRMPEGHPIVG